MRCNTTKGQRTSRVKLKEDLEEVKSFEFLGSDTCIGFEMEENMDLG